MGDEHDQNMQDIPFPLTPQADPKVAARAEALTRLAEPRRLYGLQDAARDITVVSGFFQYSAEYISLFSGTGLAPMTDASPYLVRIPPASDYLNWVIEQSWNQSWGCFLASSQDLEILRSHFVRYTCVKNPDGIPVILRFQDPRVLPALLPALTEDEARAFFGPVEKIMIEAAEGEEIWVYSLSLAERGEKPGLKLERYAPDRQSFDTLPDEHTPDADQDQEKPEDVWPKVEIIPHAKDEEPGLDRLDGPFIRPALMEAFEAHEANRFYDKVQEWIGRMYADKTGDIEPARIRPWIEHGADRALGYGLESEKQIADFIGLTFELGEVFDTEPPFRWARDILSHPEFTPEVKIRKIERRMVEESDPDNPPEDRLALFRHRERVSRLEEWATWQSIPPLGPEKQERDTTEGSSEEETSPEPTQARGEEA